MKWPSGVRSAGGPCGIKGEGRPDLGVIVADEACVWAGTFTQNAAAAAPVVWSRSLGGSPVRALVVNSGNANACTGSEGDDAARRMAAATASVLNCNEREVLVASTGVIGVRLPVEAIETAVPRLLGELDSDVDTFSRSIMTTDSRQKIATTEVGGASFTGVAKGAAMLAPNMATMLAFIATDATVDASRLQAALRRAVERSFNRISVDACESTNDSTFVLASGRGPQLSDDDLERALVDVCADLALQMVRDAEGGSKVVRIRVTGANDETHAVDLGHAVAASALWRAAVHGADPNWGRIASALGSRDRSLQLSDLSIAIGSETVFENGEPARSVDAAKKVMEEAEFEVSCIVGQGSGEAEVLTSDLSTDYVVENAWGTT